MLPNGNMYEFEYNIKLMIFVNIVKFCSEIICIFYYVSHQLE
jgi:hypothetical protein